MSDSVRYELSGEVAILRMDDGKANALDVATIGAIRDGLGRAVPGDRVYCGDPEGPS